ncbi:MAG TPA: tetratricopeptide repeat protein [Spirochaetota bacterium]|nr:tetratricopeptide repeat protein [Spirochaetota bacterium]HPI91195.1 tetratricopeptide repeat protein [Spirochaetota bacterium]HPR49578.1 tetratricopeptide repeat protein [Spirochaetota bacterium]
MKYIDYRGTVFLLCVLCGAFFLPRPGLSAERNPRLGARIGYSHITGYYENKLRGGASAGVYIIPYIWKYLMVECDSGFAYYPLKGSSSSSLMAYSLGVGPFFYYPAHERVSVYLGTLVKGMLFHVKAAETGKEDVSLKFGFSLSAGLMFSVAKGIELRLGYVFSENDLTRNLFMSHDVFAGAAYAFSPSGARQLQKPESESPAVELYKQAMGRYNAGDLDRALPLFRRVLELEPDYPGVGDSVTAIETAKARYDRAMEYKKNGDLLQALKLLREIEPPMSSARAEQEKIAGELSGQVLLLEQKGIEQYNNKNYREAVETFQNILIIDPENTKARLYLPRARKRHEAYQKLK